MHRFAIIGCGLLLCVGSAFAGPLNPDHVSADARWIVHVDVKNFVSSETGTCMIDHFGDDELEGLDEIKEALGIDVLKDVLGLTFYGDADDDGDFAVEVDDDEVRIGAHAEAAERAVAVVIMSDAADRMIEKIREDNSYAEVRKNGVELHSFEKPGSDSRFFLFIQPGANANQRLVVTGSDVALVAHAVAVVQGNAPSLRGGGEKVLTVAPRKGSLIFGTAADLDGWGEDDPASQILNKSQQVTFDMGEEAGSAYAVLAVAADSDDDAKNISQILQGLVALGRMVLAEEDEAESLMRMLNAVTFDSKSSTIMASLNMSAEDACEMIKLMAEHHGHDFDHRHDDDDDDNHGHPHGD